MNNMETLTLILICGYFVCAAKKLKREDAILRKEAIRIRKKQDELDRKYIETLKAQSYEKQKENQK